MLVAVLKIQDMLPTTLETSRAHVLMYTVKSLRLSQDPSLSWLAEQRIRYFLRQRFGQGCETTALLFCGSIGETWLSIMEVNKRLGVGRASYWSPCNEGKISQSSCRGASRSQVIPWMEALPAQEGKEGERPKGEYSISPF